MGKMLELCSTIGKINEKDSNTLEAARSAKVEIEAILQEHNYKQTAVGFGAPGPVAKWNAMKRKADQDAQTKINTLKTQKRMSEVRSAMKEANDLMNTYDDIPQGGGPTKERMTAMEKKLSEVAG